MAERPVRGTQAIDRAVDLVERVVQAGDAVSFTELTTECGLPRSTTSRLLTALERGGLLARDGSGTWLPGRLFELYAASRGESGWLVEAAHSQLVSLGEETGETIHLAVVRAGTVVHVDQVDSTFLLGSRDWIGVEVPSHASALGKVFYAWDVLGLPDGGLEPLTLQTVRSIDALARMLPAIRRAGFATTVDELEPGLTGVAAPVRVDGRVVAALGLSGPTSRLGPTISTTGAVVAAHARALSTKLSRTRPGAGGTQKEGAA